MRIPIHNLRSSKNPPPRLCDAIVENNDVMIEFKLNKHLELIKWDDLVYQVNAAKEMCQNET